MLRWNSAVSLRAKRTCWSSAQRAGEKAAIGTSRSCEIKWRLERFFELKAYKRQYYIGFIEKKIQWDRSRLRLGDVRKRRSSEV